MQSFTVHTATDKHQIICPSTWRELSLAQLIAIETDWRTKPDTLKAFSIITGLKLEITENLKDKDIERKVYKVIEFLTRPPDWEKLKPPQVLTIANNQHKVPAKIGDLMLGQKIMMLQAVETIENLIKNIPLALAIIFQPYVDKVRNKGVLKYSGERVEALARVFEKANGLECYATALFFFAKFKNTLPFGRVDLMKFQRQKPPTRSLLKKWLK